MTVSLLDVTRRPGGLVRRGPVTTAHAHVARFYREALRPGHGHSIVEQIASAPSPFSVERLLADFALFVERGASEKTRARVREAARVRLAQLRGVLPVKRLLDVLAVAIVGGAIVGLVWASTDRWACVGVLAGSAAIYWAAMWLGTRSAERWFR